MIAGVEALRIADNEIANIALILKRAQALFNGTHRSVALGGTFSHPFPLPQT